jgi:hypothetical protein
VLNGMISAQHAERVYLHAPTTRGHRALLAGRPRRSGLRVKSTAALPERVTQWLVTDLTSGWLPNTFAFVPHVCFDKVRCGLLVALRCKGNTSAMQRPLVVGLSQLHLNRTLASTGDPGTGLMSSDRTHTLP